MRVATGFAVLLTLALCVSVACAGVVEYHVKNTSGQDANDVHLVFRNKISDAKNGVFTDPPSGLGSNAIDWPAPGGGGVVPANHNFWFKTKEPNTDNGNSRQSLIPGSSYFTHDGVKLPNSLDWLYFNARADWGNDPLYGTWESTVAVENPNAENMIVTNFQVYDLAGLEHYNLDEFNAGFGSLRPEFLPTFIIGPEDMVEFFIGEVPGDTFILFGGEIALESDPTATQLFWMASAPPLPGDANDDRKVDGSDLATWRR